MTEFMFLVSKLFDASIPFLIVSICVSVLIYLFRDFRSAVLFLTTLLTSAILVYVLKHIFNVMRPLDSVISDEFGQSFPSYHAVSVTVFFGMLMYFFHDLLKTHWRVLFNTFCIIGILLVSFSRLYLGVHWFSDVFFGILLGAGISYLNIFCYKRNLW